MTQKPYTQGVTVTHLSSQQQWVTTTQTQLQQQGHYN